MYPEYIIILWACCAGLGWAGIELKWVEIFICMKNMRRKRKCMFMAESNRDNKKISNKLTRFRKCNVVNEFYTPSSHRNYCKPPRTNRCKRKEMNKKSLIISTAHNYSGKTGGGYRKIFALFNIYPRSRHLVIIILILLRLFGLRGWFKWN